MELCLDLLFWLVAVPYLLSQVRTAILLVVALLRNGPPAKSANSTPPASIAVQIATYREAPALPKLLRAIRNVRWPSSQLTVFVLDDSEGGDAKATERVVEESCRSGLSVEYIHRNTREGFKAGALNNGLKSLGAEQLVAYFDADSRPRPAFCERIMGRMSDPNVAACQARWEFPNATHSPLTQLQAAAFEYLFFCELPVRADLDLPCYYFGSGAVWRRTAIESVGGYREKPFTAEDVDLGCRTTRNGWKLSYEPEVLADNDAVEDLLGFRAQQRRWARSVGQAVCHAILAGFPRNLRLSQVIMDATALLPHASLVFAWLGCVLSALHVLLVGPPAGLNLALHWAFAVTIVAPPGFLAVVFAVRNYHPADWPLRLRLLLSAGPCIAATMTSFVLGVWDLARAGAAEFVVTAKAGQVPILAGSRNKWLRAFVVPLALDILTVLLLITAFAKGINDRRWPDIFPLGAVGAAYVLGAAQSLIALKRKWNTGLTKL